MPFEEKNKAMEAWYNECMNLYYTYNLTKEKLEKLVNTSKLSFRKGAKEFLRKKNLNLNLCYYGHIMYFFYY